MQNYHLIQDCHSVLNRHPILSVESLPGTDFLQKPEEDYCYCLLTQHTKQSWVLHPVLYTLWYYVDCCNKNPFLRSSDVYDAPCTLWYYVDCCNKKIKLSLEAVMCTMHYVPCSTMLTAATKNPYKQWHVEVVHHAQNLLEIMVLITVTFSSSGFRPFSVNLWSTKEARLALSWHL